MADWQPQSPGIWIGAGDQRLFAAQAAGQWILRDLDGAELRRSRTLLGLVAELDPLGGSGEDVVTASVGSGVGFRAELSRYGSVSSRSGAVRSCARRSGPRSPGRSYCR